MLSTTPSATAPSIANSPFPADAAALYGALINRRVTIRYPCGPVTLTTMTTKQRTLFQKARVQDISQGGVSLIVPAAPQIGDTLFLQMTNSLLGFTYDLAAEVRHATPHKRGAWLVGLSFDPPLSLGELAALI